MIRLAIAGSGGMARYHAKKFSAIPECFLSACKDHVASNAESFSKKFNIPHWYDNLPDLIRARTADALSIAVIDSRHAELAGLALDGALAVFCEKPMTRTLAEAEILAQKAEKNSIPTLVNFSKRNAPALHALRTVILGGHLGNIESVSASYTQGWVVSGAWGDWREDQRWRWRLLPDTSTSGVVGDLGSHVIDALLFMFGELSIGEISHAVDMRRALKDGRLDSLLPSAEFLSDPPVWLEITAEGTLNGDIPCAIHLSTIEDSALDDFTITVSGSTSQAVLDLRRSRSCIEVINNVSRSRTEVQGPEILSTYQQFCLMAESGSDSLSAPIPDFAYALRVQRILDALSPGGLPT